METYAIRALNFIYPLMEKPALKLVNLKVDSGEFITICGKSGCGKSTLLRLLAGLDTTSVGRIRVDGNAVAQSRSDIRIMYQDARLLPWQTVADNVALGLKGKASQVRKVALEALEQVGLSDRADEWPGVLSGGQRQRVALARALAHRPRLLLLDEPSNDLDVETLRALEDALLEFAGSVMVISHDRWFLDRVCTHILAFEGNSEVFYFEGSYSEYEENKIKRLGDEGPKRVRYRRLTQD